MEWKNERIKGKESVVGVAVVQTRPRLGAVQENVRRTLELIDEAAARGAKLIILPECCNTGYVFNNRQEVKEVAEPVDGGWTVAQWAAKAREKDAYIVAGMVEKDGICFYNSAVLVGPEGLVGVYRKTHLFAEEKLYYEPGNLGLPVFQLPFGRVGILICYDLWFPETARLLMLQGADIICSPSNWTPAPAGQNWDAQNYCLGNYLTMTAAHTNQVYVAVADRVGKEREMEFLGRSMIAGPAGWPLAFSATIDQEEVLVKEVNLVKPRSSKIWSRLNDYPRDRRTDLYDEMLGSLQLQKHPM
ncbi:hypothetical protein SY88_09035 [Clostridiales bacterium PH28_bin88]|nr:hypothetical protein SY88_09035 [Clostridiales bacterium PH28_bin88]